MPILISHCHEDRAYYANICYSLASAGVRRWDPETMPVGQSIAEELKSAINSCEACIFIASPQSLQSLWCMAELGAFWGAGKPVLIYIADSNLEVSDLPPQFKGMLHTNELQKLINTASCLKPIMEHPGQDRGADEVYEDIENILVLLAREKRGQELVFKIQKYLNEVHLGRDPVFKVSEVKEMLHQLRLYTRAEGEDGAFDDGIHPAFIEAVMKFQIRYRLAQVDGIIGPKSKQMLKKISGQAE